jgi:hypothetical protein
MELKLTYLAFGYLTLIACNNDNVDIDRYGESDWSETSKDTRRTVEHKSGNSADSDYKGADFSLLKYTADLDTNVYRKDYFLENSIKQKFSHEALEDEFKITVKGKKIHYAIVDFTITNSNGERIFHDQFPLMKVIERVFDGDGEYATFIQKDDYMRDWVAYFFKKEQFLTPAIHAKRQFEAEFSNKNHWDAIAAEPNCVGFVYSKSKGSCTEIAFDKKQGKVVSYYHYN